MLHGYSKVNEKHLRDIFTYIKVEEDDKLLDIGCGKGVVLKEASKLPFAKIAGIEIQEDLVNIAKKNFKILKLEERIECIQHDALSFDG